MTTDHQHDVLIIGSGAAGLSLALHLDRRLKIAVISKRELKETNTYYAQGGISAVLDEEDSIASHVKDTLDAGVGLCDEKIVQLVVEHGPMNIDWLLKGGVNFTRDDNSDSSSGYHLTREGGHSHRRVIHAADATGKEVETTLQAQVMAQSNIDLFEHHIAIDLITSERSQEKRQKRCYGAYILDHKNSRVETFAARFIVLATGGASKVYQYTSNPDVATGDGIAMAWRAGCRVANMEFIQFHPTCLYHPEAKSFLISEAVRGEGGRLKLPDGSRFMHRFDKREELAPRDIVARAIDHEMKRIGADCLYLDISHKPADFVQEHFPTIYRRCLDFGIDMTKQPIPVVPAAHYTCGGVMADEKARTDIAGLYVIGESAYTGLHGANRMASNSLLECLVFANLAAQDIHALDAETSEPPALPPWDESRVTEPDEEVVVSHNWDELRHFMWDYVGIVRSNKRLMRACRRIDLLRREIVEYYSNFRVSIDLLELRNLVDVADMIIRSAQSRRESRGLHFIIDYPYLDDRVQQRPTVLIPDNYSPY
ncbi:MAG: L-aspartate oxidase [gamma proteobacterium symbiont of Ctena orbiculata]|uniref:L-aspartate oxidase n=1 Tax=Candidatus Thiodiazotropha taylori TaxID=2792791 RepID=A0A944QW66_9GAMM|nr:L-aspartate oxidase [Candidatus Thiodiazotropha taylori]PUB89640.1 MAG: L-aspartate oxidase [gamma proteobacterium symbiont of Ctena orbiculata]MBT3027500.1 L-aspartate oxidase [Candidatus Thiodiazotropha taylori]MBT3035037.1 L-aspartate oxidase [Candidatus Thiodiazotropha taylori]MBV2138647.1 L-aspartate oxidase [Candidatus Thiodiazotropha taylori]